MYVYVWRCNLVKNTMIWLKNTFLTHHSILLTPRHSLFQTPGHLVCIYSLSCTHFTFTHWIFTHLALYFTHLLTLAVIGFKPQHRVFFCHSAPSECIVVSIVVGAIVVVTIVIVVVTIVVVVVVIVVIHTWQACSCAVIKQRPVVRSKSAICDIGLTLA